MLGLDTRPGALTVRTARLPSGGDPLRTRLGLEQALGTVAVPETALLVVRKLAVDGGYGVTDPGGSLTRAVERRLADLGGRARRPWRDPGAAGGDAVLFADEAELVASLARDWLAQRVSDVWFW